MPRLILIKAAVCYFWIDTWTVSRPTHLNQKQTFENESVRLVCRWKGRRCTSCNPAKSERIKEEILIKDSRCSVENNRLSAPRRKTKKPPRKWDTLVAEWTLKKDSRKNQCYLLRGAFSSKLSCRCRATKRYRREKSTTWCRRLSRGKGKWEI